MGHRDIIENGDSVTWNTLHFAPIDMHEIEMTIHEGQDEINIEHVVASQALRTGWLEHADGRLIEQSVRVRDHRVIQFPSLAPQGRFRRTETSLGVVTATKSLMATEKDFVLPFSMVP